MRSIERGLLAVGAALLLVASLSGPAWAKAGAFDTTFSGDGVATVDVVQGPDLAGDVAIQPDGKIVVAGEGGPNGDWGFLVTRLLPNGKLDTTFNGTGKVLLQLSSSQEIVGGVAIGPSGKIVVAGTTRSTNDFAFIRLMPTGKLDKTFSGDGKFTLDHGGSDAVQDVAVQSDGKIVFVGRTTTGSEFGVLGRLKAGGTLDSGFASGGTQDITFGFAEGSLSAVAIRPNGKIDVVGSTGPAPSQVGIAQFLPDGTFDFNGFNSPFGEVTTSFGSQSAEPFDVALSGTKLVLAGHLARTTDDVLVLRYMANGALDSTFGTGGHAITNLGAQEAAFGVAAAPDGKVVVAGVSSNPKGIVLLRYKVGGKRDLGFGTDGIVRPPNTFEGLIGGFPSVALQQDGRIVVSGSTAGQPPKLWVGRFLAA